jgi:hypothetical protein
VDFCDVFLNFSIFDKHIIINAMRHVGHPGALCVCCCSVRRATPARVNALKQPILPSG